ncbi:hypothetical protein PVAND_010380 [Polypedilum vanderplanki]|uniref:pyridoxal 5'-phosphate synthase n=1 Tax=Polypedilum vanderplanki TaxID=319348 RepID=A0A9J6CG29_POLVA|nr:hypothetical protein PVAND_010380 [Polypedilum vanderplanki]
MSTTVEISAIRAKYREPQDIFHENSMTKKDPFHLFTKWFDEALVREDLVEPNAMCLATVNKDGYPSARFVLLKTYDERGFTFFTNYDSRKAKDMEENPNVAATIYWLPLKRSIRIEGSVTKISKEESEVYFHSRPRASQIGALASPQSKAIPSREYLDEIESGIKKELGDGQVPIPNWGGYLITPRAIEFWQGQTNRLHDRIRFRKSDEKADEKLVHQADLEGWVYERLAP